MARSRLPCPERRRQIRKAAKVTIRRGAEALGVAPMTYQRWETGKVTLPLDQAVRYRDFLDRLEAAAG